MKGKWKRDKMVEIMMSITFKSFKNNIKNNPFDIEISHELKKGHYEVHENKVKYYNTRFSLNVEFIIYSSIFSSGNEV